MFKYVFWTLCIILLLNACSQNGSSVDNEFMEGSSGTLSKSYASDVIYSLRLPIDISRIFEETGTGFNPEMTIPVDRVPLYENPGQMALLMGMLGVDLSYCKLFERVIESAEYYKHIELLAGKLDLPSGIFKKSSQDLELYIDEPDSLTALINQVYSDVDIYFKGNNQESLASLSLLGGWLEAMYIGVKIYKDQSIIEMSDRLLQQKFALNSLSGLLANHQESLVVRRYMHPLNKLKQAYDMIEIKYAQEGFEMDPQEHSFNASVTEINYEPETLEEICQIILQLRKEAIQ